MLVSCVPYSEKEARHKRQNHYNHDPFQVNGVFYMGSFCRYRSRDIKERFKSFESRMQEAELAAFTEGRLYFMHKFH